MTRTRPPTTRTRKLASTREAHAEIVAYLQLIAVGRPAGRLIEIRYATGHGGMSRLFVPARRTDTAARTIASLTNRADVYCGALLRSRYAGGRDAVADPQLAWVEIDQPDALDRLAQFEPVPTLIVTSGTPGHAHAYWQLDRPVDVAELEQANRKLAHRLGGDLGSVDAARILRPCGTLNHKRQPTRPVSLAAHNPAYRYPLSELVRGLKDPPPRSHAATGGRGGRGRMTELDTLLLSIPASTYVRQLAGLEPTRNGKVNCPFHDDADPSLQLYDDGTFYCFGCGTGGSIYDFAARLWRTGTKGREFVALRQRLEAELLPLTPVRKR
jgi:RepB DNA-primase from phage plasmid/CHC2 zinc finger